MSYLLFVIGGEEEVIGQWVKMKKWLLDGGRRRLAGSVTHLAGK